ncbi:uncharacterized protein B0P05DRAFT_570480 [Gilbertella persicaria]|uniref:uncharacterized protein n=1 Tax=Gilbertella persicaria TaxID=101096 RepID=UPI00221FCF4D|nr:uncharacterized protein B0P05DRAFT_570480 [Gilbertella persicaria]KAI8084080.1 hypothetical protein B0P05DRAFT_570480 [Gilbertella persicaria]
MEIKFIHEKYLLKVRVPPFNNFASKLTDPIAAHSVSFGCCNAYKIPGTALQKHPETTTITFKNIFVLTSALITCKNDLVIEGMKTSSKYMSFSGHLLREAAQVDEAFLGEEEEEETSVDDDEHDNEEVEADKNVNHVEEEQLNNAEEGIVGDSNENSFAEEEVEDEVGEGNSNNNGY